MSRYAVLVGEIQQNSEDLQQVVDSTIALIAKIRSTGDQDYVGTIALNLHGFYSGAERIFRDIAIEVDQALPDGAEWHRRLLRQMGAAVPAIRPIVLQKSTLKGLNEYCSFHYLVRNIYAFELLPKRVEELAEALPECRAELQADLQVFCQFLLTVNGGAL